MNWPIAVPILAVSAVASEISGSKTGLYAPRLTGPLVVAVVLRIVGFTMPVPGIVKLFLSFIFGLYIGLALPSVLPGGGSAPVQGTGLLRGHDEGGYRPTAGYGRFGRRQGPVDGPVSRPC